MNQIPGQRVRVFRWIHARECVVKVEVEGVLLDPSDPEPYLEPDTLRHLDAIQALADAGDIASLQAHGVVYIRRSA
jgi:hypothetical protein